MNEKLSRRKEESAKDKKLCLVPTRGNENGNWINEGRRIFCAQPNLNPFLSSSDRHPLFAFLIFFLRRLPWDWREEEN